MTILRELERAQADLVGKGVVLSGGEAGTVDKVILDDLHGLRIAIRGHEGSWPVSTVRFTEER